MDLDSLSEAQRHCDAALQSMRRFELPATPRHYAVWYEYHAARNLALRQVLDVVLSNRREVDRRLMSELYDRFFSHVAERESVQVASRSIRTTLTEVVGRISEVGVDVERYGTTLGKVARQVSEDSGTLSQAVQRLTAETAAMSAKSARLGRDLSGSAERIAALEKELDAAQRLATTDGLTELPNRRAFDAAMRELAGQAMNSGDDLSLLMIDIDHFKKFNDTWGHLVGDAVLRMVAHALSRRTRQTDHLARYGGEEFALLLPQTALGEAAAIGEELRERLATRRFTLRGSEQSIGQVTISIGAARYEPGEALSDWLARADSALYRAKREGRNRVVTAEAEAARDCAAA
jgi:diguanylate cyclase